MDTVSNKIQIIAITIILFLLALLYVIWGVFYPIALQDALMVDSSVLLTVIPAIFGLMTLMILLFLYLIIRNVFDINYREQKARDGMNKQKKFIRRLLNI